MKVACAGSVTLVGGLFGCWLTSEFSAWTPYFLVLASSSFVYVALSDLLPQLQVRLTTRQAGLQVAALLVGIALVAAVSHIAEPEHTASNRHEHEASSQPEASAPAHETSFPAAHLSTATPP